MADSDPTVDGYLRNPELIEELKRSTATGAQARFMTFLQRILTFLLGSQFVYDSRHKKEVTDIEEVNKNLFSTQKLNKTQTPDQDGKLKAKWREEHKSLLKCLEEVEKSYVPCKTSCTKPRCATIRWHLWFINGLLHRPKIVQDKLFGKRNCVAQTAIDYFIVCLENLWNYNSTGYSKDQLDLLEELLPKLYIMVVSDIIAGFDLSMAQISDVVKHFKLFSKIGRDDQFFKHAVDLARKQRNLSSHELEIQASNHVEFLKEAGQIMEYVELWFVDPKTDASNRKKTPGDQNSYPSSVFPGLWETELFPSAKDSLDSSDMLTKVINGVAQLSKEKEKITKQLAEKEKRLKEKDQQLEKKGEQLARVTEKKDRWKKLCQDAGLTLEAAENS